MFIVIDGPDGVGKTTVAKNLVKKLNEKYGENVAVFTSEPTNSSTGQKIREILKDKTSLKKDKLTELFVKDRAEHIEIINNLLKTHKFVICDRYKYSTIVYQNIQGEDLHKLIDLNKDFKKPDFTFILMPKSIATLMERILSRGGEKEIFESEKFLSKIIENYKNCKNFFPEENIIFISAEKQENEVLKEIFKHINP